jgi:Tol biopolymer transport system component
MPAVHRPLTAAAALLLALAAAGTALASFPGADGRIAFSRSVGNGFNYDIYSMRRDGTGKRAVLASRFPDLEPAYSANGRRLVFVRDVDDRIAYANNEIFTKNLVTGQVSRLTNTPAIDWNPAYSPDGSFVAFSSDRGPGSEYDIFVLNLETSDVTRLPRAGDDFAPTFSADGIAIVWSGYQPNGRAEIFFQTLAGGVPQNLTNTPRKSEEEPSVNPASTHVVYQRWGRGTADSDTEIVMRAISSGATTVLTRNHLSDLRPVFSPSGNRIAWERSWDGTDTSGQIWLMRADGSNKVVRTPRRFDADSPDWQPRP